MRVLSLFSGIGGSDLGLEKAGMEIIGFCESDKHCQKVLKKHWPDIEIYNDITKLKGETLKDKNIDVLVGGFPCFARGTLIKTIMGYLPIEEVCVGDYVKTHKNRYKKVLKTMSRWTCGDGVSLKYFGLSRDILTTQEHPFYSKTKDKIGWVDVKDLSVGDFGLQLPNLVLKEIKSIEENTQDNTILEGTWVPLDKKEKVLVDFEVFNLEVEEDNSYIAETLVVHNCQDISFAGKREGIIEGKKSSLWKEYGRLIDEVKPKYAIIENVEFLRKNGLGVVLNDLSRIGYDAEWATITARSVNLPHQRRRLFIIAYPRGQRQYERLGQGGSLHVDKGWEIAQTYSTGEECKPEFVKIRPILSRGTFDSLRNTIPNKRASILRLRRVTDGIPEGVGERKRKQKIKQLGNAIVPQIMEVIGKSIMIFENNKANPIIDFSI